MKRRQFITLLSGAATWPIAARGQQSGRMRRVGMLINQAADDPESQSRVTAFAQGLQESGWSVGRNIQIEYRWGAGDIDRVRKYAQQLVTLAPDGIVTAGSVTVRALQQATHSVPIVFVSVTDPVGSGLVRGLAQPGGNTTGFMQFEFSLSGKWLELLKEVAPDITRAAVLRDHANPAGTAQFAAIQAMAPSLGVEASPVNVGDAGEIRRAAAELGRMPKAGLIVSASGDTIRHREMIIKVADQYRLPAIYPYRLFVVAGGLISYGPDQLDPYRRAAGYIDRILKGDKPADLPVQAPTKYELVINLKTAKTLGLTLPDTLLARADEVIE